MSFVAAWEHVRQSVVAISPLFSDRQREIPQIIGTGFFISTEGVVCTCRHVAETFDRLLRPREFAGIPAVATLFRNDPQNPTMWGTISLGIEAVGSAAVIGDATGYRGPNPPGIAYLRVNVRATPALQVSEARLREGEPVAFAGFPMGDQLLTAPGWLHQVSPTIHSGIVGAILPMPLHPTPHGFLVHANTQGGASGSPVFREDGQVVGMVYCVIEQARRVLTENAQPTDLGVKTSTGLTGCVSRELLAQTWQGAHDAAAIEANRPTLEERIASAVRERVDRGDGTLAVWGPTRANP
jgi:S1-C subfamily serine protease